jgi:integrase
MPVLIYLGAEHGTSKQEALSLRWDDIDFDFDGGLIKFYRTKNGVERTEFIMPRTKQALLDWRSHLNIQRLKKCLRVKNGNVVFCRLDGTPISRFNKAWNRACEIAGLKNFHYHDLRRTFCSNLLLSGSNIKDVKDMIGHKDLSMTKRYSHLTNHHRKARLEKLAKHYEIK